MSTIKKIQASGAAQALKDIANARSRYYELSDAINTIDLDDPQFAAFMGAIENADATVRETGEFERCSDAWFSLVIAGYDTMMEA